MVIAYHCALGIVIPLARVAGISIAGKKGILVRDFNALEQANKVDGFVFDKTGTETEGKWNLLDIIAIEPMLADQVLALVAGLEKDAEHFIAPEILKQAKSKRVLPFKVENIKTGEKGLTGEVAGQQIKIGSADFLAGNIDRHSKSLVTAEYRIALPNKLFPVLRHAQDPWEHRSLSRPDILC